MSLKRRLYIENLLNFSKFSKTLIEESQKFLYENKKPERSSTERRSYKRFNIEDPKRGSRDTKLVEDLLP